MPSVPRCCTSPPGPRGLSQAAAARRLSIDSIDPGTLRRWENGERKPQYAYLARIETFLAQALNMPAWRLIQIAEEAGEGDT